MTPLLRNVRAGTMLQKFSGRKVELQRTTTDSYSFTGLHPPTQFLLNHKFRSTLFLFFFLRYVPLLPAFLSLLSFVMIKSALARIILTQLVEDGSNAPKCP